NQRWNVPRLTTYTVFSCPLWDDLFLTTRRDPSQAELFGLFCQPVQLYRLLADLGVEPVTLAFEIPGASLGRAGTEGIGGVLGHRFLPLRDLHRVDLEFLGDVLDGLDAPDRFKR